MGRMTEAPDFIVAAAPERQCFFCGRESARGAYWAGFGPALLVCRRCVYHLGQLAADAFEDARGDGGGSDHEALRELERGYWFGLACARRRKEKRRVA